MVSNVFDFVFSYCLLIIGTIFTISHICSLVYGINVFQMFTCRILNDFRVHTISIYIISIEKRTLLYIC